MTLCVAGIDPGVTGAIAFYFPEHPERVSVDDMSIVAGEVDGAALARKLLQFKPDCVFLERIHFMPKSSKPAIASMFQGFGCIKGVVASLGIPLVVVATAVWKPAIGLAIGQGKTPSDKHESSRLMALRTFPAVAEHFARKKDHGRAEAALIAMYGAQTIIKTREAA